MISGDVDLFGGTLDIQRGDAPGTAPVSLSGGLLNFEEFYDSVTIEQGVTLLDPIVSFQQTDSLDVAGALSGTTLGQVETLFTVTATGGTLQLRDIAHSYTVLETISFLGNFTAGSTFALASGSGSGAVVSLAGALGLGLATGDVVEANNNVTGQAYTGTIYVYRAGQLVAARYTGITGQTYQAYENDYSNGIFTGTQYFTTGITGQPYTSETQQFNAVGQLTAVLFGGVLAGPFSAYEFDYTFGQFAGSKYTYTTVPAGATYSSYELDYTATNVLSGSKYFYTNITGQTYTGEELDYDGNAHLIAVKLTGVTGQSYIALEQDYNAAGVYTGYKAFYTNQPHIGRQEVDVSAAGVLQKIVDSGISNAAYTSAEQDYTGGVLSGQKFLFAGVTGQPYAGKELDYDGNAHLTAVKLIGVTGQAYSSIEEDYNTASVYTGYKAFYTHQPGIGQQEVDVSAAGQTQKIVDSGIANSAYSGLEQDFANGVYVGEKVFFTNVVNQPYTSYELDQNSAAANLDEILNNANGSHTILGLANNVTLHSIGNDTMTGAGTGGTGNGSGVTFAFTPQFGLDTITDFAGHLTGAGHDTISLPTSEFGTFATLVVNQNASNNAVIGAAGGDQLTLLGVTKAQVLANSGDFTFV